MREEKFKLNKKSFKSLFISLFDGTFWFGDDKLNVADKIIINTNSNILSIEENKHLKENSAKENKDANTNNSFIQEYILPQGYIKLFLKDIDLNQLFIKHNVTLKYIEFDNMKYIKSFVLASHGREIDCYSDGENESLTVSKHNNSIINIVLKEISGKEEILKIVNGIILD